MKKIKLNRKNIIIGCVGLIILLVLIISIFKIFNYIRIKNAKIEVDLVKNLTAEFNSEVKVSNFILDINGKIVDDYNIDTTTLGKKRIEFEFVNEEGIKIPYSYEITIEDTTPPLIWLNSKYTLKVGSEDTLTDDILCGDNYDSSPKCYIEGEYDLNTAGAYELVFKAVDINGNESQKQFTLNVYEPVIPATTDNNTTNTNQNIEPEYTDFNDIYAQYKTKDTKIGIDVSKWQKEIDFDKVKAAGVEFVMIRLGGTRGKDGEYFVDEYFEQNIKAANKADIPVGIYFYSYASNAKEAKKQAKWVVKKIKKYDIEMPVVFDWEEWKDFNAYNLSFFGLTSMAESFLEVIEDNGYTPMLYSSKTYLENMWMKTDYPIWLAQYNTQVTYEGDYKMWQLCDDGKVDGINAFVDIDVYYK